MQVPIKFVFGVLLALLPALPSHGQIARNGQCVVDFEIQTLPQCALETMSGQLYISKKYLPLFFSKTNARLGSRVISGHGWVYFNQRGLVVIENVAQFDNGASEFHHGLVRVVREGKWGLANSRGAIVVPLSYDGMCEYDETTKGWKACMGCRQVAGGEYHWFEGGDWIWLNRRGKVAGKAVEAPKAPEVPMSK